MEAPYWKVLWKNCTELCYWSTVLNCNTEAPHWIVLLKHRIELRYGSTILKGAKEEPYWIVLLKHLIENCLKLVLFVFFFSRSWLDRNVIWGSTSYNRCLCSEYFFYILYLPPFPTSRPLLVLFGGAINSNLWNMTWITKELEIVALAQISGKSLNGPVFAEKRRHGIVVSITGCCPGGRGSNPPRGVIYLSNFLSILTSVQVIMMKRSERAIATDVKEIGINSALRTDTIQLNWPCTHLDLYRTLSVVPVAQTFGDVCETKPYDTEDISRLVTVSVEEDQINTPICSPGAFIWQKNYSFTLLAKICSIYLVFSAKLTKMVAHSKYFFFYKNCKTHYTVEVLAIEASLCNLQSCKALFSEKVC